MSNISIWGIILNVHHIYQQWPDYLIYKVVELPVAPDGAKSAHFMQRGGHPTGKINVLYFILEYTVSINIDMQNFFSLGFFLKRNEKEKSKLRSEEPNL